MAVVSDRRKDTLIADADAAPYAANRRGKNQTVRGNAKTANVFDGK